MPMTTMPRCPACGHILRSDGTGDYICSARGGCDAEWHAETVSAVRVDRPGPVPPGVIAWFETELEGGVVQTSLRSRLGRCYELAADAVMYGDVPTGTTLVHGTIDGGPGTLGRIGHAWLQLPDEEIWEPVRARVYDQASWVGWADARSEREYTRLEAIRQIHLTGHYGRWHESDYR